MYDDECAVRLSLARPWQKGCRRYSFPSGLARFAAVVTGDDVSDPKPYLVALRLMAAGTETTVAVEDSDNGVRAAWAAGLRVAAVTNHYTTEQELREGAVVLAGFGMPATPARVWRDPGHVVEDGHLDVAALRRISARP